MSGVLSPKTIAAFKELYRVDAKIKRQSLEAQIKATEKDIEEYGGKRTTEPAPVTAGKSYVTETVANDGKKNWYKQPDGTWKDEEGNPYKAP
jgi:hypothetical protein